MGQIGRSLASTSIPAAGLATGLAAGDAAGDAAGLGLVGRAGTGSSCLAGSGVGVGARPPAGPQEATSVEAARTTETKPLLFASIGTLPSLYCCLSCMY
jgi:hypothetical protein